MSSGLLFALFFVIWIGNVDVGEGAAACVKTKISANETKIDGCQSHAYGVMWVWNTTLEFTYSADLTKDTKFDMILSDRNCSLSVGSAQNSSGQYVLSYGPYKAKSGEFKLYVTKDGNLQTGDNTVVCEKIKLGSLISRCALKYYAMSNVDKFSVTIKTQDVIVDDIDKIFTTTTASNTSTVQSEITSTTTILAPVSTTKQAEKSNRLVLIISLVVVAIGLIISAFIGLCLFRRWRNEKQQKRSDEIALHRNAVRIAEFQAQERMKAAKKAKQKVEQKNTPQQPIGKVVSSLPSPVDNKKNQILVREFEHMGHLTIKTTQNPPLNMTHALDNSAPLNLDQHVECNDQKNIGTGAEVGEVNCDGKLDNVKPSSKTLTRSHTSLS